MKQANVIGYHVYDCQGEIVLREKTFREIASFGILDTKTYEAKVVWPDDCVDILYLARKGDYITYRGQKYPYERLGMFALVLENARNEKVLEALG